MYSYLTVMFSVFIYCLMGVKQEFIHVFSFKFKVYSNHLVTPHPIIITYALRCHRSNIKYIRILCSINSTSNILSEQVRYSLFMSSSFIVNSFKFIGYQFSWLKTKLHFNESSALVSTYMYIYMC